jgi:hypothetical protein
MSLDRFALYVRQKTTETQQLTSLRGVRFQTKLALAGELVEATRAWPATNLRVQKNQPGQACQATTWLADRNVRALHQRGEQALQDIPSAAQIAADVSRELRGNDEAR